MTSRVGMRRFAAASLLAMAALLGGCVTNPVTGDRELGLVSEGQERQIGDQQFSPSRQMQGGDYVVDPDLTRYVKEVGGRVAAVSDRPLDYDFEVINSSVPNAWALPGGKIAINRGLLYELQSEAELAAVLGHEVVHAAARHGAQRMERGLLLQGAMVATAIATHDSDYGQYALGGAQIAAALVSTRYGRDAELESDRYGMVYMKRAGYDVEGAVDLQETFVRLSEGRRSDWLSGLFASHPPSAARVEANRRTAAELGPGGRRGEEDYRRATARLRETREAYQRFDEGRKALSDGDPDEARRLAEAAIRIEGREAQFYGLKGDVSFAQRNYRAAIGHYGEAIERNPGYFKFFLGRGESNRRLGNLNAAEEDIAASVRLLPTADAVAALGQIAEAQKDYETAIRYYEKAASSRTPAGRTATSRLLALDLPKRPDRYVAVGRRVDQSGRVYFEVGNRTAVSLRDVQVQFAYRDNAGQVRRESRRLRGPIQPRQSIVLMLGTSYAPFYDTIEARAAGAAPATDG
ncbi:MAG: M48 family metalloprotease [Pseudomonadota bacterium]